MTPSKVWCYDEYVDPPDGPTVIEMTEAQILEEYWPYWKEQMEKVGRSELISPERCIQDWVTVNWAWEKKDESET